MRFGVVVFPGSNCDHDAWYAVSHNLGHSAEFIWHDSRTLGLVDAVILPGGFSYGDYLRCGAIAKFSPVMSAVREFAEGGGLVLGICNGFQVLVESGLLPGALLRNRDLKFVCRPVALRVETIDTPFTAAATKGQRITLPVAHGDGCYFADDATLPGHGLSRQTMPVTIEYSAVMAVHTLWLAARAEGLGMGWVSILDPEEISVALDVPADWKLIGYFCFGVPSDISDIPKLEAAGWEARASTPVILRRWSCSPLVQKRRDPSSSGA